MWLKVMRISGGVVLWIFATITANSIMALAGAFIICWAMEFTPKKEFPLGN